MTSYGPKFTKKQIEALPLPPHQDRSKYRGSDRVYYVTLGGLPDFVLAVNSGGAKTYHQGYRVRGVKQSRRMRVGRHPIIGPMDAYERARKVLAARDDGRDPAAELYEQQAAQARNLSERLHDLLDRWVEDHAKKLRSRREIERCVGKYVKAYMANAPVRTIARRDVVEFNDTMKKLHTDSMASKVYSMVIRPFFGWCDGRDLLDRNPTDGVSPPGTKTKRQRVLDDVELCLIWRAASRLPLVFGAFVKVLLLTAQRRTEISDTKWSEISPDGTLLTIGPERMKMGLAHECPLVPAAFQLIDKLPRLGPYVFTTATDGSVPIDNFSYVKRRLIAEMAALDPDLTGRMERWTLHDFRRSARTRMSGLGIVTEIAERCLAHVPGGIQSVYDVHRYEPEKRAALQKWADELLRIVQPPLTEVPKAEVA